MFWRGLPRPRLLSGSDCGRWSGIPPGKMPTCGGMPDILQRLRSTASRRRDAHFVHRLTGDDAGMAAVTPRRPVRRLLQLRDVATELSVSFDTIDRFIRAGKLPVVRLPSGRRRIESTGP